MAGDIIRPSALPARATPVASEIIPVDNGTSVGGSTIAAIVTAGRPLASQAEAEAGVEATKAMTPLTTKQAINAQGDVRFASAAQGSLADSATQPGDLAVVATSGDYGDLTGKPLLGTAAAADSADFATAGQGATADSAVQSLTGASGITVDDTDPQNPIVSYSGAGVSDGDKGDLTVSSAGTEWALNNEVVGPAKLDLETIRPVLQPDETRLKWYGAVGDDATDDNAAFAAFVTAIGNIAETDAVIDNGIYRINSAHQLLNPDGSLRGQGRAVIKYVGGAVTGVLKVSDASQPRYRQRIRDLTIQGNADSQILLQIDKVNQGIFENIDLRDAHPGNAAMQTLSCVSGVFRDIKCSFAGHPFTISTPNGGFSFGTGTTSDNQTIDCVFENPIVEGVSSAGIALINAWDNTFIGGTSEGNGGLGLFIAEYSRRNSFSGMFFEANTLGDIECQGDENLFINIEAVSAGGSDGSVKVSGDRNKFYGGIISKITITGAAVGTVLRDVTVDTISDSGTATIIENCYTSAGVKWPDTVYVPVGTTAERPSAVNGRLFLDTTVGRKLIIGTGSGWLDTQGNTP